MLEDGKAKVQNISQIGLVVKDIDEKAKYFWDKFGIGPWYFMEFGPDVEETTYYGKPAPFKLKLAMAQVGSIQLELIQPVSGDTPHMDFLNSNREGLNHLGIFVDGMEQVEDFKSLGYKMPSSAIGFGEKKDGFGVYFDTEKDCGVLFELIHLPEGEFSFYKVYPPVNE